MFTKALGDLHGNLIDPGKCDLLLICGDISPLMIQSDHLQMLKWVFNDFVDWVNSLECDKVCLTPGNHDIWFGKFCNENVVNALRGATNGKLEILIDKLYEYKFEETYYYEGFIELSNVTYKIYGTPWCEKFGNWAYMLNGNELKEKYSLIPENVDILITHEASTLNGVGESETGGHFKRSFGSLHLTDAISRVKPRYALCGHVHTGTKILSDVSVTNEIDGSEGLVKVANCSLLDEEYKLAFKPLEFEIKS